MLAFLNQKRKYIIALIFFLAILRFASDRITKRHQPGKIGQLVLFVETPIQVIFSSMQKRLSKFLLSYYLMQKAERELEILQLKYLKLYQKQHQYEMDHLENQILRRDLHYLKTQNLNTISADVISIGGSVYEKMVRVNQGSKSGVAPNMGVFAYGGCVGKVIRAGFETAEVLLIIDPNSSVDVRNARSRARAIMKGLGNPNRLVLDYVEKKADFKVGDKIVTSGILGIWPSDILVGQVVEIEDDKNSDYLFRKIYVEPSETFHHLDHLFIYMPQNTP
jgi:rod shape-determining protein MreC